MLCKKSKSRLFRIKGTQLETKIVFQNKFEFCLKLVEVFFYNFKGLYKTAGCKWEHKNLVFEF